LECLGYKDEEILNMPQKFLESIHPEDLSEVLDLSLAMIAFFSKRLKDPVRNTFSMDFRIKRKDGDFVRILNQFSLLKREDHLRFISIGHDISHIKSSGSVQYSVAGPDVDLFKKPEIKDDPLHIETFSKREIEILNLIFQGKNSHEIAQILFISKNTVDTHRRKMLKKAGVASTLDLFKLSMNRKSKSK
jgi:PAS domain S-box-containing protein